jgi:hypothetical protein
MYFGIWPAKPGQDSASQRPHRIFRAANLHSFGGLKDATRFYSHISLRANVAYYPYSVMKEVKNNIPRGYIKPTQPADYLIGTPIPFHYCAEFARYPWKISLLLGTEEWLGVFLHISGFDRSTKLSPVSLYQNHAGRIGIKPKILRLSI